MSLGTILQLQPLVTPSWLSKFGEKNIVFVTFLRTKPIQCFLLKFPNITCQLDRSRVIADWLAALLKSQQDSVVVPNLLESAKHLLVNLC